MDRLSIRDIHALHATFITTSPTCPTCYRPRTECATNHPEGHR